MYCRTCLGSKQILYHFVKGTWGFTDLISVGPGTKAPTDTRGQLGVTKGHHLSTLCSAFFLLRLWPLALGFCLTFILCWNAADLQRRSVPGVQQNDPVTQRVCPCCFVILSCRLSFTGSWLSSRSSWEPLFHMWTCVHLVPALPPVSTSLSSPAFPPEEYS